jgi:hypothetical protein
MKRMEDERYEKWGMMSQLSSDNYIFHMGQQVSNLGVHWQKVRLWSEWNMNSDTRVIQNSTMNRYRSEFINSY